MSKKAIFFSLLLVTTLFACNRTAFINKLVGTWKTGKYILAGQDQTVSFADTTHVKFQLVIAANQQYTETWLSYAFAADSIVLTDTLGYDTAAGHYNIVHQTTHFIDTTIASHIQTGRWDLINSEQDIQLTSDSDAHNPTEYQILQLTKSHLNLLTGNQEYDLVK